MTFILDCCFSSLVVLTTAMQCVYVTIFLRRLSRADQQLSESDKPEPPDGVPDAAIVLAARGPDPSLADCLISLGCQNYPSDYQIFIILDHEDDPARQVIQRVMPELAKKPQIKFVREIRNNCSLKCSAILEAVHAVPSTFEIMAFVDADSVVDKNWLLDLVAPLADSETGATTGQRWFEPSVATPGSALRQAWNAAAIVQMNLYDIAWGGSFAIKPSTIEKCDLQSKWGKAFCEDTMLAKELDKANLKLCRVETLYVNNSESISFSQAVTWIVRQLLTVRLYHSKWLLVLAHGIGTAIAGYGALLALMLLAFFAEGIEYTILLYAFSIHQIVNLILLWQIQKAVNSVLDARVEIANHQKRSLLHRIAYLSAGFVSQFVQPYACLRAAFLKRVRWRELEYVFDGTDLRLSKYIPYASKEITENRRDQSIG